MKICHYIKFSDEEKKSFDTVRNILYKITDDDMLVSDFDEKSECTVGLNTIATLFDYVVAFFEEQEKK